MQIRKKDYIETKGVQMGVMCDRCQTQLFTCDKCQGEFNYSGETVFCRIRDKRKAPLHVCYSCIREMK